MASRDALTLLALIHRLAIVDRWARERVAHLLSIRERQAAALLGLADGRAATVDELARELDMSAGGARAFVHWLQVEALVRPEPAPGHRSEIAVRLSPAAADEVSAALAPLTCRLAAVGGPAVAALSAIVQALDDSALISRARTGYGRCPSPTRRSDTPTRPGT